MSVQRVTITSAEEQHEPPDQEIDVSVIGDRVFVTVYDGSDNNAPSNRKKAYEVPVLRLHDLIAALAAHGVAVQGFHIASESRESDRTELGDV